MTVSLTHTPPDDVLWMNLSTTALFLLNTYKARGFSLQHTMNLNLEPFLFDGRGVIHKL